MNDSSHNKAANEPTTTMVLPTAGAERQKADYRMYGRLLLTLGICAAYGSFDEIVNGKLTANSGLLLATLITVVLQAFFRIVCKSIGFMAAIMDNGSTTLTNIVATSIQLAWVSFMVGLTTIGKGIISDSVSNLFTPPI